MDLPQELLDSYYPAFLKFIRMMQAGPVPDALSLGGGQLRGLRQSFTDAKLRPRAAAAICAAEAAKGGRILISM